MPYSAFDHYSALADDVVIVGLAGRSGSGKTTQVARHLVRRHGFVRTSFGDPVKDALAALGVPRAFLHGRLKGAECRTLRGVRARRAMQTLGTEWGRDMIDPALWSGLWAEKARGLILDGASRIVVDDVRFPDEIEAIHAMGGRIWRVDRPGIAQDSHASEQIRFDPDFVLPNDAGIDRLQQRIDRAAVEFGWGDAADRTGLLPDHEIARLATGHGMIDPFLEAQLRSGGTSCGIGHYGYDLRLGGEFVRFRRNDEPLDPTIGVPADEIDVHRTDEIVIGPGEFVLAHTVETLRMPEDVTAEIKDKSTLARLGIAVQTSPGHSRPDLIMPCHTRTAQPNPAKTHRAAPCHAVPGQAQPDPDVTAVRHLSRPRIAKPRHAVTASPHLAGPSPNAPLRATPGPPYPTSACLSGPRHTQPRPPRQA